MSSIRSSLILSLTQKYLSMAIGLATSMIIARLLTPAQIGAFSVGVAVTALATGLRDFGVTNYIIQEAELTDERLRTALGASIAVAWPLGSLLFAASEFIADFYDEKTVGDVVRVVSLTFFIIPFNTPIIARLKREMDFGALLIINVVAQAVGAVVSILLALRGWGAISLGVGSLAAVVSTMLIGLALRPYYFIVRPMFTEWRRIGSFGGKSGAISIVSNLAIEAPELVIGKTVGLAGAGIFSRGKGAYFLYHRLVMEGIGPVLLPDFARTQRERGSLSRSFVRNANYLAAISWPFYGFLAIVAYPLIIFLFGNQWGAAASVAQVLCLNGLILPFHHQTPAILIAAGKINYVMRATVMVQPIYIALILLASGLGLEWVAAAWVVQGIMMFSVMFRFVHKAAPVGLAELVPIIRRNAAVTVGSLVVPLAIALVLGFRPENALQALAAEGAAFVVGWFIMIWLMKHPLRDECMRLLRIA
jgi:O-antigen/teichoic acid export membrane protein